ncbi:MAG: glutamyl-tRNA reductase [Halolamina sp.]
MRAGGVITGVSVAHGRADVDEVEAAASDSQREVVRDLLAHGAVEEAFAIQTCNRVEAYVVTDDAHAGRAALSGVTTDVRDGAVARYDHEDAIRHLMRVAAGLESLVLGEDQILGQLKRALEAARDEGAVGQTLEDALLKAVHVGERARSETAINEGTVSLGGAAVELAHREVALDGATAVVVGAGEMGTLAARALSDAGVDRLVVANRTVPHAEHVAREVDAEAEAIPIDRAAEALPAATVAVTATGAPEPILGPSHLRDAGEVVCIDIAQPRDVAPEVASIDGVTLCDIDDLEAVTDTARDRRRDEARTVERMIDEEFERLLSSFKRRRADEAVSGMYEGAERVKSRELNKAVTKLEAQGELTADQRETVEDLADALVGQLLAAPTKSLREAAEEDDWTTIQTAMQLFDPNFNDAPSGPPAGVGPHADVDGDAEGGPPPGVLEDEG